MKSLKTFITTDNVNESMKSEFYKEDKNKAEDIANNYSTFTISDEYRIANDAAMAMAEWKNEQFQDWFINVGFIKVLHFINEKQKSENETIDTMKWGKLQKEFKIYLNKQK